MLTLIKLLKKKIPNLTFRFLPLYKYSLLWCLGHLEGKVIERIEGKITESRRKFGHPIATSLNTLLEVA